jgi:hypothetical protein
LSPIASGPVVVPHFYFESENGVATPDEEGLDFVSAEAARLEATRAAAEMMRDRAQRKAEPADISLIVRDGSPEPVCTVTVALTIQ